MAPPDRQDRPVLNPPPILTSTQASHASPTTTGHQIQHATITKEGSSDAPDIRSSTNWNRFSITSSTTRNSVASSILSRTLSTASTVLTRYSSVRSSADTDPVLVSPISPWNFDRGQEDCLGSSKSYWCTLCSATFESISDWKLHELQCPINKREQYICSECQLVYPDNSLLALHRRDAHGLPSTTSEINLNTLKTSVPRNAWGCGFCAAFVSSQPEYLDHVGRHYDEGRNFSEWRHSFVIKGLLRQPGVEEAWRALVVKMEPVAGKDDTFFWDPRITGRSTAPPSHVNKSSLQDMLECFATGQMRPQAIAKAAYDLACTTAPGQADDTVHALSMGINIASMSSLEAIDTVSTSSTFPGSAVTCMAVPDRSDDIASPLASEITSTHSLPRIPPRPSYTLLPPVSGRMDGQRAPSTIYVKIKGVPGASYLPTSSGRVDAAGSSVLQFHPKRGGLRRVDSERNLVISRTPPNSCSPGPKGTSSNSQPDGLSTTKGQPSPGNLMPHLEAVSESPTECKMDRLTVSESNDILSLRAHSNSSVLSAQTADNSVNHNDSASEVLSSDSVSEPDLWPNFDGNSAATKKWSMAYQHTVDGVMDYLWLQYNNDWDAMIREHVGNGSNDTSRAREPAGRTHGANSSHHAPNKIPRPSKKRRPVDGDDKDDNGNGYRPNTSPAKPSSPASKRFACPFRKHDPRTYNLQDHQICAINTWPNVSRLKEHLYRKHCKTHCPRCKTIFSDSRDLDAHEMSVEGCAVLNLAPPGDITTAQEKQLRSKKATAKHLKEEEKWANVYQLLFPDDLSIPSPYPEYTRDLGPISPESRNSLGFQHYLLRQMPALFRQAAEEHLGRHIQSQEGLSMETIPVIIQDSLQKAFRDWETGSEQTMPLELIQSPGSFTSYTTNDPLITSPTSPPSIHPWAASTMAQLGTNSYTTAMQSTAPWGNMSEGLVSEIQPETLNDANWLSHTTANFGSYDPLRLPTTGLSGPSIGSYLPLTTNHGDPYMSHDPQMGGYTLEHQPYF